MNDDPSCQASRYEELFSGAGAALFSFAMGLSAVAAPLLALSAGYDPGQVGVYVAGSALAQLATRGAMSVLMRRIADKQFVILAGFSMALSCALFVGSTAWWAFLASQIFQGVARGLFWTGTQTHAVRTSRSSVGAIAKVNLASGIGLISGPVVAGPIVDHWSAARALTVAAISGLIVMLPAALMVRLPPMRPPKPDGASTAVWRRPGVGMASWAGASAGAWRSLMNSYVPIIMDQARQSSSVIGVVVGVSNATSIAGGAAAGWIREARLRSWLVGGILVTGLGLTLFGLFAGHALIAGAALALSGAGAGLLQTVGPALATEAVSPEERGEAIASAGTFRAAALLAAPLAVAGLITVTTLPVAVAIAGAALALPPLLNRRRSA